MIVKKKLSIETINIFFLLSRFYLTTVGLLGLGKNGHVHSEKYKLKNFNRKLIK